MKLEVAMLVGAESKAFLASMTNILERMEKLAGQDKTPSVVPAKAAKKVKAGEAVALVEAEETTEDESIETFGGEDEGEELGFDSAEETEDEAPVAKPAKASKLTDKDVHTAALAHAKKHGRPATLKLLKAKFGVASIAESKAADYAKVIAALK